MTTAITVILALLIGALVGFLAGWITFRRDSYSKKLEQELEETKKEFQQYQSEVATHISRTASLLGKIQDTYQHAQEHVYRDAQKLNRDENRQSLLQPQSHYVSYHDLHQRVDKKVTTHEQQAQPPKDYA